MDFIDNFDIVLEKEHFYAGEEVRGYVYLKNHENFKVRGIRSTFRGKAHAEWKIIKNGEKRTVKDGEYFFDEREVIWGKDRSDDGPLSIMTRGVHRLPLSYQLPQTSLPGSFESRLASVRYYVRVVIDVPYASDPMLIKYFTVIAPYIHCMDERYLPSQEAEDSRTVCCLCCKRGPIRLSCTLERSAYCCGEFLRLKCKVENQTKNKASLQVCLYQYVEYFIDRGVLGMNRDVSHVILESHRVVEAWSRQRLDLTHSLRVPACPPTMLDVCRILQIYYILKVCLVYEKSGEVLPLDFPITIATVPFRIPTSPDSAITGYVPAAAHVEGGLYVSPEFQVGQVYDGSQATGEESTVLYRPVYVYVWQPGEGSQPPATSTTTTSLATTQQEAIDLSSCQFIDDDVPASDHLHCQLKTSQRPLTSSHLL